MILVRAPLRISFFGGGSDLPQYYMQGQPGYCLSTTIDKSLYLGINRANHDYIKVVYSEIEQADDVNNIKHNIVRETLKHFDIKRDIEISTFADIPVRGTGMGSSSSYAVALIQACANLTGVAMTEMEVAELACTIEIDVCKEPIGKQDQYAAAYGGMNLFKFNPDGSVEATKCHLSTSALFDLETSILLFYTGISRDARDILKEQSQSVLVDEVKMLTTQKMADMAVGAYELLGKGHVDLVGGMLNKAWTMKKSLATNMSNPVIDQIYDTAMKCGAWGGKVLGAGGGGFVMVMANPKYHTRIRKALKEFTCYNIKLTDKPTEIVYNTRNE